MTSAQLSEFAPNSNALQAAEAVRTLINAAPRTPSVEQIAAAISPYASLAPSATCPSGPLQEYLALCADECDGMSDTQVSALTDRINDLERQLIDKPLTTAADLADLGKLISAMMPHTGIAESYPTCADAIDKLAKGAQRLRPDAERAVIAAGLGMDATAAVGATAVRLSDINAGGSPPSVIGEPRGARPHKRLMQLAPGFFWSLRETSKEARGVLLDMAEFGPDYPYPLGREIILAQKGDGDPALYEAHRHAGLTWLQRVNPVIADDGRTTDLTFEFADHHATPINHNWRLCGLMRGHVVSFYLGGDDE